MSTDLQKHHAHFTLEDLRPGLQAILALLSSCDWAEIDSCLYGSVSSHGRDVSRLREIRRIKDAFPQEVWTALEREGRLSRAARLRAEAAELEASHGE